MSAVGFTLKSSILCLVGAAAAFALGDFRGGLLAEFLALGLLAVSLDLLWGYGGLFSLGQTLPFGIGAYASMIILQHHPQLVLPALAAGLAVGLLAGLIVSLVTVLRGMGGLTFALFTLIVALAGEQVAQRWNDVTGGFTGLSGLPQLGVFGLRLSGELESALIALVALLAIALAAATVRTPLGRIIVAVKDNPLRMASLGYNLKAIRSLLLMISGALAGLAGALYAPATGYVYPGTIGLTMATSLVLWTLIGGRQSIIGPVLGALIIGIANHLFSDLLETWWVLAMGLLLIVIVVVAPNGIWGPVVKRLPRLAIRGPRPRLSYEEGGDRREAGEDRPLIEATNVEKKYGWFTALSEVNFAVRASQVHCVVGPNGAGKTTFLDILTGVSAPSGGEVTIAGIPRPSFREPWLTSRAGVGRKFQAPQVIDGLTVEENLAFAAMSPNLRSELFFTTKIEAALPEIAKELMRAGGIDEEMQTRAADLSHGQKQWLELCMVVARRSAVILLDEPTAGMTPKEAKWVGDFLKRIGHEQGCGVAVIEHDIDFIRNSADEITVLAAGRVLANGDVQTVVADKRVQEVYAGLALDDDLVDIQ